MAPGGRTPAFLSAWLFILTACASGGGHGDPPSDSSAETVRAQQEHGESLYRDRCEVCHEQPDGSGEKLSPYILASYYSARNLHDYIALAMPHDEPGSLSEEEYWAVTAYLVADRGVARLDVPLAREVADSLRLSIGRPE